MPAPTESKMCDPMPKLNMTGVLLAGGKSSRMGTNKAFLKLNEKPLIERGLEVLDAVFDEVLISANDPPRYAYLGKTVVADNIKDQGPLGGLQASLLKAQYDKVFFVACDMPFIEGQIIRYLAQKAQDYDIVIPVLDGDIHPLHSFYSKRCLPRIEQHLKLGKRKLQELFPYYQVYFAERAELEQLGDIDRVLANINTPEEWQRLMSRAGVKD